MMRTGAFFEAVNQVRDALFGRDVAEPSESAQISAETY
jgi:hypothetical protein